MIVVVLWLWLLGRLAAKRRGESTDYFGENTDYQKLSPGFRGAGDDWGTKMEASN